MVRRVESEIVLTVDCAMIVKTLTRIKVFLYELEHEQQKPKLLKRFKLMLLC